MGRESREREREIRWGIAWLTVVPSNNRRAGQAPEGDISLQLCKGPSTVYSVVHNSWAMLLALTNGFSLDQQAWALKEAVIWQGDPRVLSENGNSVLRALRGLPV